MSNKIILKPPLYLEDWYKRSIHVHTNTANKSAIKIALLFKKLGVKNNLFPLSIFDKELMKYDVHNLTDNSKELKERIAIEAKANIWYYLRECVRIPIQGGDPIRYKFDRANTATTWVNMNNINVYECIPRQRGKTIGVQAIYSWIMYVSGRNLKLSMLAKDNGLRQDNVRRLKDIRDALPEWMIFKSTKDTDNKEGLRYDALNTTYATYVAQSDPASADNLGRGSTTPGMHWDELATFKYAAISYDIALNSTLAAVETARANGQPCSNIITTTPGILSTSEGRFAFKIFNEAMPFTESLYDLRNEAELRAIVKDNSGNDMILTMFSYLQLGASHEWFINATRKVTDKSIIPREFLLLWDLGTSTGILSKEKREEIFACKQEPTHTEFTKEGYVLRWYVDKLDVKYWETQPLVMGLDGSEMVGNDFCALVAINPRTLDTIFTCRVHTSSIPKFGTFVASLMIRFTKMILIPEQQSIGRAVIDFVVSRLEDSNINPYSRIFNYVVHNRDNPTMGKIPITGFNIKVDGNTRKYFGYRASNGAEGRNFLFKTIMGQIVESYFDRLRDSIIIDELVNLEVKHGRIDHSEGNHDDTLMAYLLAAFLVLAGKNLQYYGIENKVIVSSFGRKDAEEEIDIETIQARLVDLKNKIENTDNTILKMTYKQKYDSLASMLVDKDIDISSMTLDSAMKHRSTSNKVEVSNKQNSLQAYMNSLLC